MANIIITLYVDTQKIREKTVDLNTNFGQDSRTKNENYVTRPGMGDTIIWQGISSVNVNDEVNITRVEYEGGKNVFHRNPIDGVGNPETVTAAIANHTDGEEELYTIYFSIVKSGEIQEDNYHIDPKIQVHP